MDSIWVARNFLALPDELSNPDTAGVIVMPVPYDSTTSFRTGAREGPQAIIEASYNLEDYDPELDADVSQIGIYTAPWLEPHMGGPRLMTERVSGAINSFIRPSGSSPSEGPGQRLVALLGGEHSVSVGHVHALSEYYPDLSVLYLDAHGDLRNEYMGTTWGHASVARRISEICPVVQVGVRSVSLEEMEFIRSSEAVHTFFWPGVGAVGAPGLSGPNDGSHASTLSTSGTPWGPVGMPLSAEVIRRLSSNVYVTVDLDVFDSAIMPAVGTPEPGGMDWYSVTSLLRSVAEEKHIVGFDVAELSPREGPTSCSYTAAKLVYKLIAYATLLPGASQGSARGGPAAQRKRE